VRRCARHGAIASTAPKRAVDLQAKISAKLPENRPGLPHLPQVRCRKWNIQTFPVFREAAEMLETASRLFLQVAHELILRRKIAGHHQVTGLPGLSRRPMLGAHKGLGLLLIPWIVLG
jgi:hypothetical protein